VATITNKSINQIYGSCINILYVINN